MCECSHWEICLVFRLYLQGPQQLSTHLEIEQNFNSGGLPTFTSHIYWLNKLKLIQQTMVDISQETPVGLEKWTAARWKLFNINIRLCYLNASIATITMSQLRMSADCRGFILTVLLKNILANLSCPERLKMIRIIASKHFKGHIKGLCPAISN